MKDWRFWSGGAARHADWRWRSSSSCSRIYIVNHPAGFTANVVQTAANKGVLLALVAMAQTLVVLTAGIDLSVGMIFILTNCVASYLVVGSAGRPRSASSRVLADRRGSAARSTARS